MLLMNDPVNGGAATLPFGGSEFTVLLTFQVPLQSASMRNGNGPPLIQLLAATSTVSQTASFSINLDAMVTGANSGSVTARFAYRTSGDGVSTTISTTTPLMVATPMLIGGWVSAAFSLSAAGVATLSVRDIFSASNATSTGAPVSCGAACATGLTPRFPALRPGLAQSDQLTVSPYTSTPSTPSSSAWTTIFTAVMAAPLTSLSVLSPYAGTLARSVHARP
jgi:hypothetical protein